MKAIVSVLGADHVGILAYVCAALAERNVNILDVTQTILQDYFTMSMLVDVSECSIPFGELAEQLHAGGAEQGLEIRIQREEIFLSMHQI